MSNANGDKYVKYGLFFATIAMVLSICVLLYNTDNKLSEDMTIIKVDVGSIKTSIEFIIEKFEKQEIKGVSLLPEDAVLAKEPIVYDPNYIPPTAP